MQRNRLAAETSPYLLQHADNPVDWYPWGEQALLAAQQQNKPILLSIGYSACHWCHVMAHESFEDPATAALMNQLFVNIKVDREERPDLDKIYQVAQQLITQGNGGWPLTMFLTPGEQTPFFGGTYFPKEARYGMPAFGDLLRRVAEYYRSHGAEIAAQNEQLKLAFTRLEPEPAAGDITLEPPPLPEARASRQHRGLPAALVRHVRRDESGPQGTVHGRPDADTHGRGRPLRSAGRRFLALFRRRPLDDPPLRENALRQCPVAMRVLAGGTGDRRGIVCANRRRDRRLGAALHAFAPGRLLFQPGCGFGRS